MPIRRQSVKVLRFWYRLSVMPEAQALSHAAFRWLWAITIQWNGFNNGALELTKKRHGTQFQLNHTAVYTRARDEVLKSGLVMMRRAGGRNQRAQYALALIPLQLGTDSDPTAPKILGTDSDPIGAKTGTDSDPNWVTLCPKKNGLYRRSRARLNRKVISKPPRVVPVESHGDATANPDAGQGGDVETQAHVSISAETLSIGKPH